MAYQGMSNSAYCDIWPIVNGFPMYTLNILKVHAGHKKNILQWNLAFVCIPPMNHYLQREQGHMGGKAVQNNLK